MSELPVKQGAKRKVVVTDYIETDLEWEYTQAHELEIDFSAFQLKNAFPEQLIQTTRDADIVVVNMAKMSSEVIAGLERCKLIIRHGIGYDNVDVQAATERNIMVGYVPDYCVTEVAEQALTLIMACQRKLNHQIDLLHRSVELGAWDFQTINPVYRLRGKTIGIVGFGRIGRTVYEMLKGFGVHFIICDPYLDEDVKNRYGIQTVPLETLLKEADVVTIHCPLKWQETYHMFDEQQFKMMKKSAVLINTARGGIVNLDALDNALQAGDIAFAGIDVYETEPPAADFQLLRNPRAICTPHLSWLSEESGWNIREKIMIDIRRFLNGQGPINQVNPEVNVFQSRVLS